MPVYRVVSGQTVTAAGNSDVFNTDGPTLVVQVDVTAISGTAPSIQFTVEWSLDGTDWAAAAGAASFPSISAVGNVVAQFTSVSPLWRLAWTVSGTLPSVTFSAYQA